MPNIQSTPTLAVCGSTGAGKSSLINALMRADICRVGVTPTTSQHEIHDVSLGGIPVYLMDTPGLGEADKHAEYATKLLEMLPSIDLLIWVVGYDNRALDMDVRTLTQVRAQYPAKPILVLGNAVDRTERSFDPKSFNPDTGESEAERDVGGWLKYLRQVFVDATPAAVLPCAAGEAHDDAPRQYNLTAVSESIESLLPAALRTRWLECERVLRDKSAKGDKIVLAAIATAGGIGLVPLPMADMPFIIATQVGMILALCNLYGRALSRDTAKSLVLTALSAVAGPMIFQTITKFIPGLGSVVGAGVAAGCTFAVGKVTQRILESGQQFELDSFKAAVRDLYKHYRPENKQE